MNVQVVEVGQSARPNVFASVSVEVSNGAGDVVVIHDVRILKNKSGEFWAALPTYNKPTGDGKQFEFQPTVELSRDLKQQVLEAALNAFEASRQQAGGAR